MLTFILFYKDILNRVKIMLCAMLWYAMEWYDEWEYLRLYAMIWNSNAMVWDSNAMVWDSDAMLFYRVCCKRSAWTDCKNLDDLLANRIICTTDEKKGSWWWRISRLIIKCKL